jgi:hypothetical protein
MYTGRNQMEYGGQMAMGGDLKVLDGGYAETISYNPYMPGTGETVMFRGRSHDDGGIPIEYGQNGVEVEGGEPMFQMENGGKTSSNTSGIVAGNLFIPDYGVNEINDPKAKGKKFKHYIADLSKQEAKVNKSVEKGVELVNNNDSDDPFDQLAFNSGKAMMMGGDLKLKTIAERKLDAAAVQNAILDTAEEFGVESDALAKGKIKYAKANDPYAKFGAKMETFQKGGKKAKKSMLITTPSKPVDTLASFQKNVPFAERSKMAKAMGIKDFKGTAEQNQFLLNKTLQSDIAPLNDVHEARAFKDYTHGNEDYYGWNYKNGLRPDTTTKDLLKNTMNKSIASGIYKTGTEPSLEGENTSNDWKQLTAIGLASALGQLRPSDVEQLDAAQLAPEMMALATNQLEPVQAQTFQPLLSQPTSYSLQDQLNEVTAQTRAAERLAQGDPSALAMIAAQGEQAKSKILGEQFRMNQAEQQRVAEQNRNVLNDANLKNLAIYDTQYTRQAEGASKTKAQAIEAMKSIADKTAKNKLENRQLGVMENMYNYRFNKDGQAYNLNNPQFFNMYGSGASPKGKGLASGKAFNYDDSGQIVGIRNISDDTKNSRNGSIVKAIKGL